MELKEFREEVSRFVKIANEFVKGNKGERGVILSITTEIGDDNNNASLSLCGNILNLTTCIAQILKSEDLEIENMMAQSVAKRLK